jgi:hypothetical protein
MLRHSTSRVPDSFKIGDTRIERKRHIFAIGNARFTLTG